MRLAEYQNKALRTESVGQLPSDITAYRLTHCCLGITTEIAELVKIQDGDPVSIKEESGDTIWYIAAGCSVLGFEIDELEWQHLHVNEDLLDGMVIIGGDIVDIMKRHMFYGTEINESKLALLLAKLLKHLVEYLDENNIDLEDCLDANIDKLKARMPKGFCKDKVVNRDLDNERRILEQ